MLDVEIAIIGYRLSVLLSPIFMDYIIGTIIEFRSLESTCYKDQCDVKEANFRGIPKIGSLMPIVVCRTHLLPIFVGFAFEIVRRG